jgi:hypothetical protein
VFGEVNRRLLPLRNIDISNHIPDSKVLMWGFKMVMFEDRSGSEGMISHAHVESRSPSVGGYNLRFAVAEQVGAATQDDFILDGLSLPGENPRSGFSLLCLEIMTL